jgi:hypothetical protein
MEREMSPFEFFDLQIEKISKELPLLCSEGINTLCVVCPFMKIESVGYGRTRSECKLAFWRSKGLYNPVMQP